jgi:hypothetical protein
MSTEHDEQPTELTYPTNDEQPTELTTIRLVLASDDSDKENHIPNIRRDEIAVKLEQPTTESLGGNSTEGTGGSTAIDRSDPLRQDLPRSVTPDTGTNGAETTRTMASIPDVLRDEIDRQPLRPIPLRQTQTRNQSFSNLRSGQEIHDRINYIAAFAGLTIAHDDQHRLARLWSLLKDDRFAVAVTQRARGLFNWQCADLIEIFINIAKLEWNEPLCPGTSIEQFGLDLLRRILAADVERLYDAAIDDVRANQYGVIPKNENPMDLIYMKYTHPLTIIAPDRSHTIELINNVQDKTNDLAYYINKLSDLAETIQRNTKWTKKVYLGGAKPQTLTGEVIFNIEHFIADVENDYHGDCMTPYRRYAANPRRCIHCQGTHASEDHHLSVSIPIVSNSGHTGLSPPQEQTQTNTDDNTSHKHKNTRFALPTQQSAFAASQQQQRQPWPLPPRPTPPTPSRRLTPGTASFASTRKSRTSYTTSRTSASPPPHPYRPVPTQRSNKKGKQSSSSSVRNDDRSGSSRASSIWSTPTTKNSSSGMKTHQSHETKTGEPSHGDPSHNGKIHRRHHRLKSNHHSKTGSSTPHNNHPHHYNPRADETDYDDYETPEIGDIHGDEVYNNID